MSTVSLKDFPEYGRHWRPSLCVSRSMERPEPGMLIALPFDRKPYRVVETRECPVVDWIEQDIAAYEQRAEMARDRGKGFPPPAQWDKRPFHLLLRPAHLPEPVNKYKGAKSFVVRPWAGVHEWFLIPEQYAVCVQCGELSPCRDLLIEQEVQKQAEEMERKLSVPPGCCWACHKPITKRHKSIEFEGENVEVPGGPAVAFHLRGDGCGWHARQYEKKWVKGHPDRTLRLHCDGRLTYHYDGVECSEGPLCTGPTVHHDGYTNHRVYFHPDTLEEIEKRGGFDAIDLNCLRCRDAYERGEPMYKTPAGVY